MDTSLEDRLRDARLWAAEQMCVIDLEGEVGFGRECVGVLHGSHYVDTPGSGYNDFEGHSDEYLNRVKPPKGITAYHKHDCLCVLGHGDVPLRELLSWVDKLRKHGATVRIEDRRWQGGPNPVNLLFHGPSRAVISFPDLPEDDKTVYYWETEEHRQAMEKIRNR